MTPTNPRSPGPSRRGHTVPLAVPGYVWDGLVPAKAITHIVGASGVGKSTLAAPLAPAGREGR